MNYYIFIIMGILLFLLYNHINRFTISNQYVLTQRGTGLDQTGNPIPLVKSNPNAILLDMLDKISTNTSVCALDGFGACELLHNSELGSCQINSIVGLYRALDVPFQQEDRDYINSLGNNLRKKNYLPFVYTYLTNRPSMRALLVFNDVDPSNPILIDSDESSSLSILKNNALYTVFLESGNTTSILLRSEILNYGHNLLMYKTNYMGFREFMIYENQNIPELIAIKRGDIIDQLMHSITNLSSLSQEVLRNGNVCIMIDLCQKKFYAVTEVDYPSTVDLLSDDGSPPTDLAQLAEYNTLWKLKLNMKYLQIRDYPNAVVLIDASSTMPPLDLSSLTTDNTDLLRINDSWKNSENFKQHFNFNVVFFKNLEDDYTATNLPLLPPNFFRGNLNTLCNTPPPPSAPFEDVTPLCNPSQEHMICAPKEVNGVMYNVCQLDSNHCSVSVNYDDDDGGIL